MNPQLGKAWFQVASFITIVSAILLFFEKSGTAEFVVTVLSLIIGVLFLVLVIVMVKFLAGSANPGFTHSASLRVLRKTLWACQRCKGGDCPHQLLIRITNYRLRITNYRLQITNYQMRRIKMKQHKLLSVLFAAMLVLAACATPTTELPNQRKLKPTAFPRPQLPRQPQLPATNAAAAATRPRRSANSHHHLAQRH